MTQTCILTLGLDRETSGQSGVDLIHDRTCYDGVEEHRDHRRVEVAHIARQQGQVEGSQRDLACRSMMLSQIRPRTSSHCAEQPTSQSRGVEVERDGHHQVHVQRERLLPGALIHGQPGHVEVSSKGCVLRAHRQAGRRAGREEPRNGLIGVSLIQVGQSTLERSLVTRSCTRQHRRA